MKKLIAITLIAVSFLGGTVLLAVQTGHTYTAKTNGGMNDPPDGRGILFAAKPNGGSYDPPEGTG